MSTTSPLTQATTSSLDALNAFSAGEERRAQGLERDAIPFYERAITLDPGFSLAYARLNAVFANVGEWSRSAAYADEAFARQGRASERERFYIATGYYIAGLALRDGTAAAAEFQKILDHRGIAPVSILYPLAFLQQGRAYALVGEIPEARKAYESFLTIWTSADPDVPIFQDAKREYDRLPPH